MKIQQAFRYELDPNDKQRTLLAKAAGTARFTYNWALARRIERFEKNEGKDKFTNAIAQHRELNALKDTEFPWMREVSKCAPQEALRNLDRAFKHFWRGRKQGRPVGFPEFKKKGLHDAFRLTGAVSVTATGVKLPRIGEIRTKEMTAKFDGRVLSATVRREADRWFVALAVERERPEPQLVLGPAIGIDLGLTAFATLSDGTKIEAPKPLKVAIKRLQRRSRRHSCKQKGSANRRKSALRLGRLHRKVRNTRNDWLHKFSTHVAKNHSVVCVEGLNVSGMVRNRSLSRSISDAGWGEFRRMLVYKTKWYGSELRIIDRFAPSSRTCSVCGVSHEMTLADRTFVCRECGVVEDRDLNAAKNVFAFGMDHGTESSSGTDSQKRVNACGEPVQQGRSRKQEADAVVTGESLVLNG